VKSLRQSVEGWDFTSQTSRLNLTLLICDKSPKSLRIPIDLIAIIIFLPSLSPKTVTRITSIPVLRCDTPRVLPGLRVRRTRYNFRQT